MSGLPIGFKSQAEYDEWKAEMAAAKGTLDDLAAKADRARYAELAGEVWDFAGYAGVQLPAPVKKILGALAFFAPIIKLLPLPKEIRPAVEKVLEGAELADRVFG